MSRLPAESGSARTNPGRISRDLVRQCVFRCMFSFPSEGFVEPAVMLYKRLNHINRTFFVP